MSSPQSSVVNVLCTACASPDTVRIVGGNEHKLTALYGCKECGETFVTKRVQGTDQFPAEPEADHART